MKRIYLLLMLLAVGVGMLRAESKVYLFIKGTINSEITTYVNGQIAGEFSPSVKKVKNTFSYPVTYYNSAFQELDFLSYGEKTIKLELIYRNPVDNGSKNYFSDITLNIVDGQTYYIELSNNMTGFKFKEIKEKDALKKMKKWEQLKTVVVK